MTSRKNFVSIADKQLNRIQEPDRERIMAAIASIGSHSRPSENVRGSRTIHKLKIPGKHAYYRVFYKLTDSGSAKILRIEKRGPATYHRINPPREKSLHIRN